MISAVFNIPSFLSFVVLLLSLVCYFISVSDEIIKSTSLICTLFICTIGLVCFARLKLLPVGI